MDLRLSDEQHQIVDSLSALLCRFAAAEHVRAAEDTGFDSELWKRVVEFGAVPMAVPEAQGGWGGSLLDLALVAEQIGRTVAPGAERRAFGVPIGSFQAISHPLADSATAVDGARLLAYEAAWARDEAGDRFAELAAMAFAFAYEAARDVSLRSLRFHGGYGFMMEYDVQLYYRRARAWANVYGEPAVVLRRVADKRYGPASPDDAV